MCNNKNYFQEIKKRRLESEDTYITKKQRLDIVGKQIKNITT
jgi:hypothetical protein